MIPPADKTEMEEFMKKDAGCYDDRTTEFKMQKLEQEDAAWVKMRDKELIECLVTIEMLSRSRVIGTASRASEIKTLAERLAHEASKLQKTLEGKI